MNCNKMLICADFALILLFLGVLYFRLSSKIKKKYILLLQLESAISVSRKILPRVIQF